MKKIFLVTVIFVMLISVVFASSNVVLAEDDATTILFSDGDVNSTPSGNTSSGNTSSGNTSSGNTSSGNTSSGNNTPKNNTNTNTKNTNTNSNTSNNNTSAKNNVSNYSNSNNTTNIPKTGIEDSIPTMALVVVFGISAVYAYKKINDYKNV